MMTNSNSNSNSNSVSANLNTAAQEKKAMMTLLHANATIDETHEIFTCVRTLSLKQILIEGCISLQDWGEFHGNAKELLANEDTVLRAIDITLDDAYDLVDWGDNKLDGWLGETAFYIAEVPENAEIAYDYATKTFNCNGEPLEATPCDGNENWLLLDACTKDILDEVGDEMNNGTDTRETAKSAWLEFSFESDEECEDCEDDCEDCEDCEDDYRDKYKDMYEYEDDDEE